MVSKNKIEEARQSLFEFLETFKLDLIGEVKKAVQIEMAAVQDIAKSPDQVLMRQEAADLLNCSLTTLCQYQKEGKIPFYKVGKKVIFKREELLESIRKQVKKGGVR